MTTINLTGGLQTFTAPATGVYDIVAYGAQGGADGLTAGGLGAEIGGDVTLTAGETLQIAVGQAGGEGSGALAGGGGGGGGGSFVVGPGNVPLMVAGAGGGAIFNGFSVGGGQTSLNGSPGIIGRPGGIAGYGGYGDSQGGGGGGGGGFKGGAFGSGTAAGQGFPNLGGGAGANTGGNGGFGGGGGGGAIEGGGGGGYSGGGSGAINGNGGGGGSFDAGNNQVLVAGENTGSGKVVITPLVAQASTITGATANQPGTGGTAVAPFAHVSITDPNPGSPTETVTVTPSNTASGTLSNTVGGMVSNGVYTVSGSAGTVTTDLEGLDFTPAVAPGQKITTGFTITDPNSAGITSTNTTTSVVATAAAAASKISGTVANQPTTDQAAVSPFARVSITDPNGGSPTDAVTITLTGSGGSPTDANGTLSGTGLSKTGAGTYALAATSPTTLSSELDALTFAPTKGEVGPGQTVTTGFTIKDTNSAGLITTDSTTSVVAKAQVATINGPPGGHAVIKGTPGADQITAHGTANAIFGEGGNDVINAGDGAAVVTLGNGNATVTLGGGLNAVTGGTGNTTVTGAPDGYTAVKLGDGNDTVTIGGSHDVIALGTGTDMISGTQGMAFITTGAGNDTITVGGSGNHIDAGGGTNTITGGSGHDTFVLPKASQGFDVISAFSETNGDVLDLRAALGTTSWTGQASTLGNYLKVIDSGGNTTLSIAATGSGAGTAIATLSGVNYGLPDLLSHHSLLTG